MEENKDNAQNAEANMENKVSEAEKTTDTKDAAKKAIKRSFVGLVSSDKMDKTIVVSISTKKMHRLYKKYVTRTKKYMAHDEKNEAHIGDTVKIIECRPLSRHKCFRLVQVVERAR